MSRSASILIVCGSVIALVILGVLLFKPRNGDQGNPAHPDEATTVQSPVATPTNETAASRVNSNSNPVDTSAPDSTPVGADGKMADWSDKVDGILASDVPESDKVKQFLEMFPKLPEAGQVEVANHLSNLLPNENYPQLAAYVTNAALPVDVLDILLRDALTRPNSLKLPVLLDVARTPQHPKAEEAKETLAFVLEENDGDDWAKWQAKMEEWLKANPD